MWSTAGHLLRFTNSCRHGSRMTARPGFLIIDELPAQAAPRASDFVQFLGRRQFRTPCRAWGQQGKQDSCKTMCILLVRNNLESELGTQMALLEQPSFLETCYRGGWCQRFSNLDRDCKGVGSSIRIRVRGFSEFLVRLDSALGRAGNLKMSWIKVEPSSGTSPMDFRPEPVVHRPSRVRLHTNSDVGVGTAGMT